MMRSMILQPPRKLFGHRQLRFVHHPGLEIWHVLLSVILTHHRKNWFKDSAHPLVLLMFSNKDLAPAGIERWNRLRRRRLDDQLGPVLAQIVRNLPNDGTVEKPRLQKSSVVEESTARLPVRQNIDLSVRSPDEYLIAWASGLSDEVCDGSRELVPMGPYAPVDQCCQKC